MFLIFLIDRLSPQRKIAVILGVVIIAGSVENLKLEAILNYFNNGFFCHNELKNS